MQSLLEKINSPRDLKALEEQQLGPLCEEIRARLIDTVSSHGGHLASNLGVVELTVALHRVFDCPRDAIIFDVGHQCYTHKLLTGRRETFDTLRQQDGIAGFPKPSESDCDPFIEGHSSTALSAAIGLARAWRMEGRDNKVIAVLGDGSFGGGMVYEAINNIDHKDSNLVVVLNDNEMSISKSVGSVARYLLHLRTNYAYSRLKRGARKMFGKIPLIGGIASRALIRLKKRFRRHVFRGTLFEELGFNYIGAIDGHDMDELCRIFSNVQKLDGPILIHVRTTKGKGYLPAETNPGAYHGVGQFDLERGNPDISEADSFSNAFGRHLCEIAESNDKICAITAAMKYATGLHYFAKRFPERFFDVGIAEEHAITFSAGLARGGKKPVIAIYSTFLQRAFDQLAHDIVLSQEPVLLAIDRAGMVGDDGETHQGLLDVAMLSAIGGFTVASPCNYDEMTDWLSRLSVLPAPCALRFPRGEQDPRLAGYQSTGQPFDLIQLAGGAQRLMITYGRETAEVLDAAEILNATGVPCDVLKLNIILPLSPQAVEAAAQYPQLLFAEEGVEAGGLGERFLSALNARNYKGSYVLRAVPCAGQPHATVEQQLAAVGLDAAALAQHFLDGKTDERTR